MFKQLLLKPLLLKPLATATFLAGALFSFTASADNWNMPTPYGDGSLSTQIAYQFAKDIKTGTDGEIDTTVHSGGSLIKHPEIPRAVRTGQVQMGEIFIAIMGNAHAVFKHDNIPFLATSFDDAEKLWNAAKPEVEKQLDKQGMTLLYTVPWPPQGLYSKVPIEKMSDMKGRKMRAYSPSSSRLADLMETTPTTVEEPEIAQAFSTGIIDAMITSPSTGVNGQAWDYVSNYTDIKAWIPKNIVVVNKRAFQRLPEEQRQVILDAAAKAEKEGWKQVRVNASKDTATLAEKGIKVAEPSEQLKMEFKKIGDVMTKEWEEEAPEEVGAILKEYR